MHAILENIKSETAELLAAQARRLGLSIDEYLKLLLGILNDGVEASATTPAEFEADLQSFSEGTEHLPPTPLTYSREDIYFDHD
jgi:hypothetical protein